MKLHVITDTVVQSRFTHEALAAMACEGGADVVQLRDKALSDAALLAVARRMVKICTAAHVRLIVNDRVAVAAASGADGVHLGRTDAGIAAARAALGSGCWIGGTAHTLQEAIEAEEAGADYVGFGHVFATASKSKATPPVGTDALARVCASVRIPVVAIGGITAERVAEVLRAGAGGIAVIGAVCAATDPRDATRILRGAIDAFVAP